MYSTHRHPRLTAVPLILAVLGSVPAPEPISDPDAYAIYAALLPQWWPSKEEPILLQQETTIEFAGTPLVPEGDVEWRAAGQSFVRENGSVRLLQPLLLLDMPYRLISKAEIDADDARLAQLYPGMWQRRPESVEYAAVSVVGFNAAKDRAIVYIRFRSSGGFHYMEKRGGVWVRATLPVGVGGWIASARDSGVPQSDGQPLVN